VIRITEATFVTSAPSLKECMPEGCMEVVFLGRSNVGKSSLINGLTGRKNLAKKSSTPGKTRLINFFEVVFDNEGEKFHARFVDLPGFGYAKVSKTEQMAWQKHLSEFIERRASIRLFVLLVDARHPELEIDHNVLAHVEAHKRPDQEILTLFTKSDKLKQNELAKIRKMYPKSLFVSVLNGRGVKEANATVFNVLFGEPS
jgi:GTP-binding protein